MVQSGITGSARRQLERGVDSGLNRGRNFEVVEMGKIDLTHADADLLTFIPSSVGMRRGRLVSIFAIGDVTTTDTNADATITAEVNGAAVTGGVLTLADISDGTAAKQVVKDQLYNCTAITGGNTFDFNDYIDVALASSNAFLDGVVTVFAVLESGISN